MKPPVAFFIPSLLTLSPFVRARKSGQMHLVSRECTTSTSNESHVGVRSWVPEAPSLFFRSIDLLERE